MKQAYQRIRLSVQILTGFLIFSCAIVVPAVIIFEFGFASFAEFYIPYYPHLVYYPTKFLWAVGFALVLAWSFVPLSRKRVRDLFLAIAVSIIVATGIVWAEQGGNRMMVLEFNEETQELYCMHDILKNAGKNVLAECHSIPNTLLEQPTTNDRLFSYTFWTTNYLSLQEVSSWTRLSYLYTSWVMIFTITFIFLMIRFMPPMIAKMSIRAKYATLQMTAVLFLALWIPLRGYYNSEVKFRIFSEAGLLSNLPSVGGQEVIIILFFVIFLFYAFFKVLDIPEKFLNYFINIVPIAVFSAMLYYPDKMSSVFGFDYENPVIIMGWLSLMFIFLLFPFLNQQRR